MIGSRQDRDRAERLCREVLELIDTVNHEVSGTFAYASKNTGALRRRSMDLTRALADLRRSS